MGATSHGAQRLSRTPLEVARSAAASAAASARTAPVLPRHPAVTPSLVVIVAASRAEQQRLLACLPPDVPVLVTARAEQAEELLHTLHSAPAPAQGPTVRAAERTVSWTGGHSVRLTPLEFALLQTLISEQGRVWSFPELSSRVWATGFVGDGAQVRAVVKRLRRKLAEAQAPVLVETVRGAGFRLAARPGPGVST